jgi:hypothetical protein
VKVRIPPGNELEELAALVEPYGWSDVTPVWYAPNAPVIFELRVLLRADAIKPSLTAQGVRRELYARAEAMLSHLETAGWRHVDAPAIELTGSVSHGKIGQIKCEVRLQVAKPEPVTPSA